MHKKALFTMLILALMTISIKAASPIRDQFVPLDTHGPGYGFFNGSEERWEGEVWAHYDENGCPGFPGSGVWEVGVEGILDNQPLW